MVVRKEVYRRRAGIASYLVHVVSAGCGSSPCLNNERKTGMWVAVEESPPLCMPSCVNCVLESCAMESCTLRQLMYIRGWDIFLKARVVVVGRFVSWGRAVRVSQFLCE